MAQPALINRPGASYNITLSSSAASSQAVSAGVTIVRLFSTVDSYVNFNGTATVNSMYLPAYSVEYFEASPGQTISALQVSASGTLNITELSR